MRVNANAISTSVNIPVCMSIEYILGTTHEDAHLQELKTYIIQGWPHEKKEVYHSIRKYWPIRHELTVIDGIAMKGKIKILHSQLQKQIL